MHVSAPNINLSVERLIVVFKKNTYGPTNFMLADPLNENISKNRQVDVFSLVFVSAEHENVSARLTTDLFIKNWVGQCRRPKSSLRLLIKSNRIR